MLRLSWVSTLRPAVRAAKTAIGTRLVRTGVMIPLLALLPALNTGCANDQMILAQANQAHGSLEQTVIDDPVLTNYLKEVGDRIIEAAREMDRQGYGPEMHRKEKNQWMFGNEMKFHFVNSKTMNAFTTGGNHMYIYTGLFTACKTEDELAAVMAHEFAHVYGRHVHKGMNRQLMTVGAALGAGALGYAAGGKEHGQQYAGLAAGATMMASQLFGNSFTRKDEAEADDMGFDFYARAGWDPDHFGDFFQRMIDKGYDKTPEMLSDHPTLTSRVENARKLAKELPPQARNWRKPPVADADELRRLQRRAVQVGRNMPTSESLAKSQELLRALPRSCLTPRPPENIPDQQAAQQQLLAELQEKDRQQQQRQKARRRR